MPKKKTTKKNTGKNIYQKIIKGLWIAFAAGILMVPLYVLSVRGNWFNLYGGMPSLKELDNPQDELSSELYSADGVLLGKYFRPNSNRTPVDYVDLSKALRESLLAAEDIRFRDHSGIDLKSVLRAASGVLSFRRLGGGSTLSQQLAKNLFDTRGIEDPGKYRGVLNSSDRGVVSLAIIKTKEWILSVILESKYTKEEIMAKYLNTIPLGYSSFGIKVAAKTYFNTTPDSLTIPQAAVLVGLANGPSRYNPRRHPERALKKRNRIIRQMEKYEYITKEESDSLQKLDLVLNFNVDNQNVGPAPYFRKVAGNFLRRWAKENNQDLYEGGLRIYTTIDSKMQTYAEESVNEHMSELQKRFEEHWKGRNPWIDENWHEIKGFIQDQSKLTDHYRKLVGKYGRGADSVDIMMNLKRPMKIFTWEKEIDTVMSSIDSLKHYKRFLQTGFMAMDPHSGYIKAWVGGINHKHFKWDHVKQGRRQPGSTFKPFVYATAIEYGYSPCMEVHNVPVTFSLPGQDPPTYTPKNSTHEYDGQIMTIREALARSINQITAFLMRRVKPENVVQKAKAMGIKSPLDPVPALCLGVSPVSVYEMVGAYSTFANEGIWTEPIFITRIEDKNGNVLYDPTPTTVQALSEENAYVMLHMLQGGTQVEGGTGMGLGRDLIYDNEIGAKTGTTQNASDGWFMGVTRDLVAGAWVGASNQSIHFRNWADGQGGRTALPIYRNFMTKVYADEELGYEKGPFKRPAKRLPVELDCNKYKGLTSNPADSLNILQDSLEVFEENDIF